MSGWISVKDALPEPGEQVLTLDRFKNMRNRELYEFRNGTRLFLPDGLKPVEHITHWMPLPEPPKEERNAE